jgi:hypothetical protein
VHRFGKCAKVFLAKKIKKRKANFTERRAQHGAPLQGNNKNRRFWRAAAVKSR